MKKIIFCFCLIWLVSESCLLSANAGEYLVASAITLPERLSVSALTENIFEDFLQQKYTTALEKLKHYLARHPDDPTYLAYQAMVMSVLFSRTDDYRLLPEMYQSLDRALQLDPENFAALFVQGEMYFYAPQGYGRDLRLAADNFLAAARSFAARKIGDSRDLVAQILYVYLWHDLGLVYYAQGNFSESVACFKEVEKYPLYASAILEETRSLRQRLEGQYDGWKVRGVKVVGNRETDTQLIAGYFTAKKFSNAAAQQAELELKETGLFGEALVYAEKVGTRAERGEVEVVIKAQEKDPVQWWLYPLTYSRENLFGKGHSLLFEAYYYSNLDSYFWNDNYLVQLRSRWRLDQKWAEELDAFYLKDDYGTKLHTAVLGSTYKLYTVALCADTDYKFADGWRADLFARANFVHPAEVSVAPGEIFNIPQADQVIYEGGGILQWQEAKNLGSDFRGSDFHAGVEQGLGSTGQYNYTRWSLQSMRRWPLSENDDLYLNGEIELLNGSAPHFKLPYLGGWGKLRGYSRLDLCGDQTCLLQVDYKRVLGKFFRDLVIVRGVLFGEGGGLFFHNPTLDSGKIYADGGAGIEVYAFPADTCRFRMYGALTNQGAAKLIYTFAF